MNKPESVRRMVEAMKAKAREATEPKVLYLQVVDDDFDYGRYRASREWAVLRRKVKARAQGWCERCGREEMVAVHHLTYSRIGHELLEDLQGVGRDCHDYLSGKSDFDPTDIPPPWIDAA